MDKVIEQPATSSPSTAVSPGIQPCGAWDPQEPRDGPAKHPLLARLSPTRLSGAWSFEDIPKTLNVWDSTMSFQTNFRKKAAAICQTRRYCFEMKKVRETTITKQFDLFGRVFVV